MYIIRDNCGLEGAYFGAGNLIESRERAKRYKTLAAARARITRFFGGLSDWRKWGDACRFKIEIA